MQSIIKTSLKEAQTVLNQFLSSDQNIELIQQAIGSITSSYNKNGKVISCGNGGSMCDAMHFAEELTGRFRKERRPLEASAISDPSHITCVANDYGYEFIFSRYIDGFFNKDDVLLAISTSGNSPNVINAVHSAKTKGGRVIGLLGKDGGKLKELVDIPLIVPSNVSDRIQEIHIKIIHIMIENIERALFPENY
ncbi:MAG: D-sedoheptulose 7-phosphate isomerase [Bacteriovoracaceae bacterium]|jgi:D-sedoheptulose 7-phosphate isomerase|nr:D-sedoheptulose 7-phosphate isomerase [Bacteriovoracaceae bacterium]